MSKKKTYGFTMELSGTCYTTVQANSLEEAAQIIMNGDAEFELGEWDVDYPYNCTVQDIKKRCSENPDRKFPRVVRFKEDDGSNPNFVLTYKGSNEYWKSHGAWGIKVKKIDGKIICCPDYPQVMHLKGKELVECTPEEIERDKEYL